jgi:hypothetical protein
MPNITRGSDPAGLLRYLAGPGRANEHVEPHLVAGDPAMLAWWDDAELNADAARGIAGHLDAPRRRLEVEVPGGHVWHCSLSLHAEEGELDDDRWRVLSEQFVDRMGFTASSGKAACRWVAIRHGRSTAGNDHVHLVVSLVRNDGTKASVWNDRPRAQHAAAELEVEHGLRVTAGRAAGLGSRGVKPAEQVRATREGRVEPVRVDLARRVRAAAVAAGSEAEFVRRLRADRVLVHPRFAAGRGDVVVGYSVADRPRAGERPVWFGGGRLDRDLTLPRLRSAWADTPEGASGAVAEWTAAGRNRRPVSPGAELDRRDPLELHAAAADLAGLREHLRAVPVEDRATWAAVAHDGAGVFAAWSRRLEATPGPLAATADQLARSAQVRAYRARQAAPANDRGLAARRAAALLLQASGATPERTGELLLLRQLSSTLRAVHDAHEAVGAARLAADIAATARASVVDIVNRYERAAADVASITDGPPAADPWRRPVGQARTERSPSDRRSMPSPIPDRLEPGSSPMRMVPGVPRPGRDRDFDRE